MTCLDVIVNKLAVFLSLIFGDESKIKNGHHTRVFNAIIFVCFATVDPTRFDGQ